MTITDSACRAETWPGFYEEPGSRALGRFSLPSIARTFVIAALLAAPGVVAADTVNLGVVSFNTLIPSAPGSPGVNDFEIDNFTASADLPPDFPVSGSLTFKSSSLLLTFQGGAQQTILLGDLAPGVYTQATLQFSALTIFTSALFKATLDNTGLPLFDGSSLQAESAQISVNLIPLSGATLTPDSDFALISVDTAAPTTVPEADTTVLEILVFALIAGMPAYRRSRRIG